jgi:hypothetical protein
MKDQETLEERASITSDWYLKRATRCVSKQSYGKSNLDENFELKNHRMQYVRATNIL